MTSPDKYSAAPPATSHEQKPVAIIALAAAMLLILFICSRTGNERAGRGLGTARRTQAILEQVAGQTTIDREWPMVTGIPEGDVEFDKTSLLLPSSLFDISSSPLLGPVRINGNVTVGCSRIICTSDACKFIA